MHKRACEAFEAGKDVIYDATNLSSRRRVHLISSFQKYNIKFRAIIFNCPYEVCLDINSRRQRVVPEYAMKRMYHSFEPPHYAEGFHSIEMVYFFPMHVQELLDENIKCPHDNPHHRLSCGEHCLEAENYVRNNIEKWNWSSYNDGYDAYFCVCDAARYHDVSKFKCKAFNNAKGEKSEIAHYYNHEKVSAYDYLVYMAHYRPIEQLICIANLIALHMIFFVNSEKAIDKKKQMYGERFWKMLEILHEADVSAH